MSNYQEISVDEVIIAKGRRKTDPKTVKALADSIKEIGLQNPIGVTAERWLMHGLHRLAACELLGWTHIPATIHDFSDLHAELAEIDENLIGNRLTATQESRQLSRRKAIYLELYPDTKQGAQGGGRDGKGTRQKTETDNLSFSVDTAAKTGKSERTIERSVKLGEGISDRVAVQLDGHHIANNKTQLGKLAELRDEDQQLEVLAKIDGKKAKTVPAAMEALKIKPSPLARCSQEFRAAVNRGAIKISKAQIQDLLGLPTTKRKAAEQEMMTGKDPAHAINPRQKPIRKVTPEQKAAQDAKAQIKVWYETIGRWLGGKPNIDEYLGKWPGKPGDDVLKAAKDLYKALRGWEKVVK